VGADVGAAAGLAIGAIVAAAEGVFVAGGKVPPVVGSGVLASASVGFAVAIGKSGEMVVCRWVDRRRGPLHPRLLTTTDYI